MRATRAIIDTTALTGNLRRIRSLAPGRKVWGVVKANAYGHGLGETGHALRHHVDGFGVACVEEAVVLRGQGIKAPVLLLEGLFDSAELSVAERLDLELVVHSDYQVEALMAYKARRPLRVWVKMNSGMNRLGFPPARFREVVKLLAGCAHVAQPVNLMTHFANADAPPEEGTEQQWQRFEEQAAGLSGEVSAANSAAILQFPKALGDWVRPGLLLYGVSPLPNTTGQDLGLAPVMTLESRVIARHRLQPGDAVGYGFAWRAERATDIGIVAIGYGDGYPRHARQGTPVWVGHRRCPLVGRVSMDMIAVDLGPNAKDPIGERAVLWGKELPVEEVAQWADTIPYELLCGIARRVNFKYA